MDGALAEFSRQGYGASSVNTICAAQGISKGIIYHYFDSKDDLFLACVEECFQQLTGYLQENLELGQGSIVQELEAYFAARMAFFRQHPVYQRIFCEAILAPPAHLRGEIQTRKQAFEDLNGHILARLLEPVSLRPDFTKEEVIDTFRQFQDFTNARYPMAEMDPKEFESREKSCRNALNILLYGIIERKEP